ncbi:UDP-2,4-diacetamido-2,4,6-trideoxy-beta-L-altropyranose hydrolase [Butyrivibrio sp. MC2013]|uniref:UDP-2,4-diacetamido-2,4, 6-trideoxy-beta-L-altropyranose hydrolase n=1 Tax=Butyrivibrio sp. MC2013 TaxID=1280686 RepID=UPI000408249A|nr:UDP-2,4-diacetamido-2,4,6-trideoxy-beta-L-altropyranose hydrolase [Butyrivibrio sp. MC2013]
MIYIRADANKTLGSGHIMRCLSIAGALSAKGEKVKFVTADHDSERLVAGKYEMICLDSKWDDLSIEEDRMKELLVKDSPDMLILDHYYADKEYVKKMASIVRLCVMEYNYPFREACDMLVDYAVGAEKKDVTFLLKPNGSALLGPTYAPLRSEFAGMPPKEISFRAGKVLISTGGGDPLGTAGLLVKAISEKKDYMPGTKFMILAGAYNPDLELLEEYSRSCDNIEILTGVSDMPSLMKKADIAVSAAGSTLYELCSCGTPTITYILADNQKINAMEFQKKDIMLYAGDCRNDPGAFAEGLLKMIRGLSEDVLLRKKLSMKMQKYVDGKGSERIARAIL